MECAMTSGMFSFAGIKRMIRMKTRFTLVGVILILLVAGCDRHETTFKVRSHAVEEDGFQARAISPREIRSDYPMVRDLSVPQPIIFKLSLNGQDNEGAYGQDHHLIIPDGITEFYAPTLRFGERAVHPPGTPEPLRVASNVHFRADLRPVLRAFERSGEYITPTGQTIKSHEFQGLYMAGGTSPLQWIWDLSAPPEHLRFTDVDGDSIYELSIRFAPPEESQEPRRWTLRTDLTDLPVFTSPEAPLLEALTNLALEEAVLNIRADGAFSAGAAWQGVWTRDVAYASQLSLAYLFPENVKTSLRAKLSSDGRIIQDTGTGGSWPISSDRHIWTLAAWEVFLATGDKEWLEEIREPVLRALQEDLLWNRDPVSGMLLGETSFEDWREQTYPPWMSAAEIHGSHALSTNIIFKRALEIGLILSEDPQVIRSWPQLIDRLDRGILRHFWRDALGAPASYVMAVPAWTPAPHRDLLGESLGIHYLSSFTSVDSQLVASYPRTAYGSPVISHQLPHSPAYHNKAIWPFVEAYSLLAAKQVGNQAVFAHGFNGLTRAAALFLSHQENFEYATGRPDLTQVNSDRQLWSIAGWLGAVYKGLFGLDISYDFDSVGFELSLLPNNPFPWSNFALSNLKLHDTPISIRLKGSGSEIRSLKVNGIERESMQAIPLEGEPLNIVVELGRLGKTKQDPIQLMSHELPASPAVLWRGDTLSWTGSTNTTLLELNGRTLDTLTQSPLVIPDTLQGFFTLVSKEPGGARSLPSDPHYLGASATLMLRTNEPYFVELGPDNTFIELDFSVPRGGNYLMRFSYANGSGPVNTGKTCGLAKLRINSWWLEQMVSFPHTGNWDDYSRTAWVKANFQEGKNTLQLDLEALPVKNMDGTRNHFRVTGIEIIPL